MASQDVSTKSKKTLKLVEKVAEKKVAEEKVAEEKEAEEKELGETPSVLNKLINDNELAERERWNETENDYRYLYPDLNDPLFNQKIAEKKEFNDTKYDGKIYKINEEANKLCDAEFELSPHQQFVRNFLSFQTPYNSLLLYHGLGSGKTCSAIGVAEEMRDYLNQLGINQRIIVVASPNVQENFKIQLFDETKLKLVDGLWSIKSCTGNKLLREINPLNMKGLTREKVISQIKHLINSSYLFLGYTEFAHFIEKKSDVGSSLVKNKEEIIKNKLRQSFNNRLIIIDEVHNIRITDDNKAKRVAQELFKLVKNVDNLRLLFLSATPLYNNYKEIVWLINIMNLNDKRSEIDIKDVFDYYGNFRTNEAGVEIGKELLQRKATGYISFVRGDNPYTFPYRISPKEFAPTKTLQDREYPQIQLNGKAIIQGLKYLSLYITNLGEYQTLGYNYIIDNLIVKDSLPKDIGSNVQYINALGYIELQRPLEALNIVYPNLKFSNDLAQDEELTTDTKELVGKNGLDNIMIYKQSLTPPSKTDFEYKTEILSEYGRIFSQNEIQKYSGKIKEICNSILNSEGIILIYSLYLDGGLVPIALALEEMGITRHGTVKSLFKSPPVPNLDLNTYTNTNARDSIPAKYIMITGNKMLSPNNVVDLKSATQASNVNGSKVKVILISQAGAEGLDFKFIRQVHVLEPWYNLSRIEQIIGRAVRNCSHKDLPFEKRNVEIFLYGSRLANEEKEAADLYVYRLAELKAVQIGHVNRVLKEIAVDCLLNSEQLNFTAEIIQQSVIQVLSNGQEIEYQVGDKPYTAQCDYMETCLYECKPTNIIEKINELSYSQAFIEMNTDKIIYRIKQIMKDGYFYNKYELIKRINIIKPYPLVQIYAALNQLVTDKNEFITDRYGRLGNLINIGEYYFFQPLELNNENISLYERQVPIPFKHDNITIPLVDKLDIPSKETLVSEAVEKIETAVADDPQKLTPIPELSETLKSLEVAQISKPKKLTLSIQPETNPGKKIIQMMFDNYKISNSDQLIVRGEDNWYKYSSIVLTNLQNDGNPREILEDMLISHLIETQLFGDIFNVLNYLYSKSTLSVFEQSIKNYFDSKLVENKDKNIKGILLQSWDDKKAIQKLIILDGSIWKLAEAEDYRDLLSSIKEVIIPKNQLNDTLGFITNFKNRLMIFKIKYNKAGYTGAVCEQGSKLTVAQLNEIRGEKYYNEIDVKKLRGNYLCVLGEYLLRLNDYNRKNDKRWFLTPAEAVIANTKDDAKKK